MMPAIARVLVDAALPQLDRLLDYRIPPNLEGLAPGVRVRVPLRAARRVTDAFVIELADEPSFPGPLSDVLDVVSPVPVLRPEVWALARAAADRAAGSAIDVLRLAIPTRQARVEKAWLAREEEPEAPQGTPPEILDYPALVRALEGDARVALRPDPGVETLPSGTTVGRWARVLARAAARTVLGGRSAILVAPDYRDEDQLAAALADLLPTDAVVRLDARGSNPERYRALLRAIDAAPVAIVGTRSAVYAPAARLGLLAVWDDGDPLLGEPLAPYVHARDAALLRHEQQGGALVFAGHSRSTEVQRLVEIGHLAEVGPERPRRVKVIPTDDVAAQDRLAAQARIPSVAWRAARTGLESGPVLVQVARPGYAPGLRCAECGEPARCRVCTGPLRVTREGGVPECAWCGRAERAWRCPSCQSTRMVRAGAGSTRTAEELGRAFPGVRVIVSDGEHAVESVEARPALVIATRGAEPIAAGGYRAVLLLDGPRMLLRESLRVAEDCLRWWSHAAALAADDGTVLLVGVGGSLGRALATGRQSDWARDELAARRELRFPPAVRVATLRGTRAAVDAALAAVPSAAELVARRTEDGLDRAVLRFEYGHGPEVARAVRAEIVRQATSSRGGPPATSRGRRPLPLRARFDDPEPFDE
ncbi:MAG: hypothetical protein J0G30_13390 [Actinomycetales bacterium]|nr:hypothetical protein [Actinomycetales bacterium]